MEEKYFKIMFLDGVDKRRPDCKFLGSSHKIPYDFASNLNAAVFTDKTFNDPRIQNFLSGRSYEIVPCDKPKHKMRLW